MTGFDSRRVSWVTLGAQAMNKRTGVLSEYPSLTGFPLIPYYSCQSPLVILLITLRCPSFVRLAAAASMRAEQGRPKKPSSQASRHRREALTSTLVCLLMSAWAFSFHCRPLLLSSADMQTRTRYLFNIPKQPVLFRLYKKHQCCRCVCDVLVEGCYGPALFSAPALSANRKIHSFHTGSCSDSILFGESDQLKSSLKAASHIIPLLFFFFFWWRLALFDGHSFR